MSILMDFVAGDAGQIGAAIEDCDDLRTAPSVVAHVDFSLHLTDESLDTLFALICARRGAPALSLQAALTEQVAGAADPMEQTSAAHIVTPALVELVATLTDSELTALATEWTASVGATPGPDVSNALTGLRNLCVTALSRRADVVFAWSL